MQGKLTFTAIGGPLRGKAFTFEEHDTFIFGRSPQCHARLPDDDMTASRHHFVLELSPPEACIRDLGSLNGTFVNDKQIGKRASGETPEAAAQRAFPTVPLRSGDTVRVGHSVFALQAQLRLSCLHCGVSLGRLVAVDETLDGDAQLCAECREQTRAIERAPSPAQPPRGAQDPGTLLLSALGAEPKAASAATGLRDIPGYTLGRELGVGGMGSVYLGTRVADGAPVAIKVMLARIAVNEAARQMFAREIETTRTLSHPNIVHFIDAGSAGEAFYFVLEYCDEGSTADLQKRRGGRLELKEAGPIMMDALAGLAHAHKNGFVHRDIKPHNILLTRGARRVVAKIADMGLSKSFAKAGLSGMTATGGFAGSYAYMPVEQLTNFKFAKPPGDVWSLGATFYQLLTGRLPREIMPGQDPIAAILAGGIVPIRQRDPGIPAAVAEVIDRSLAHGASERYPSASEMWTALGLAL